MCIFAEKLNLTAFEIKQYQSANQIFKLNQNKYLAMPIVGGIIKRAFSLADKIQGLGQSPLELQQKTLQRLLKKAEYTAFGSHYDFDGILKDYDLIRAFQDKVPFFDYDKIYNEWWHRALNNSEINVTWPGQIPILLSAAGRRARRVSTFR